MIPRTKTTIQTGPMGPETDDMIEYFGFEESTARALKAMEDSMSVNKQLATNERIAIKLGLGGQMSDKFDFVTALGHLTKNLKCRRASWPVGKYVYRAADDSSTLRFRDAPDALSKVYHPTPDLFATDWEFFVETCTFAEAIEHLRQGGRVRRAGWQDTSGNTFIQRFTMVSEEIWVYFPGGSRQAWRGYAHEILKNDWIKIPITSVTLAKA